MSSFRLRTRLAVGALLAALGAHVPLRLAAQVERVATVTPVLAPVGLWRSAPASVSAAATSLTIRINSGATQVISSLQDNAVNAFPAPVSITTEWDMTGGHTVTRIDLVAYFASPASALATTGATIPSSRVEGRMVTGRVANFTPFTGNAQSGVGTPGASLYLLRQQVVAPINVIGSRTDQLELRLNLTTLPALPVGTYTGTLTLRAVAF